MEGNVALDTTKQRKFVKSIKGIKNLIKKNENEEPEEEGANIKPKKDKVKRKRPERGLVYLSHIPHGFYEHQMTQYFKQFGVVTNARVIRSKRTGNSKGFAFVEFREPAVAEIVAETMNNYLMGKRLIKAAYVPPEKQRPKALRKHWSQVNNPGRDAKLKIKKAYNENKDEKGDLKRAKKIMSNLNKTKTKLSEMGINYDFFVPVDVPEALQVSDEQKESVKDEKVSKKDTKEVKVETKNNKQSLKGNKEVSKDNKSNKKEVQVETKKIKVVKSEGQKPDVKKEKKKVVPAVVDKKEQKQKQQKLKDAGVAPLENFMKVTEHSEDSDSSLDFDSDEYEKVIEDDGSDVDSDDSGDEEDGDSDGGDSDGSEEIDDSEDEEIVPPPKKSKGKVPPPKKSKGKVPIAHNTPQLPQPKKQVNKQNGKAPEQIKRKVPQSPVITKKPKFEKQSQQPIKKQFKKKK